jgi:hypothetical protein
MSLFLSLSFIFLLVLPQAPCSCTSDWSTQRRCTFPVPLCRYLPTHQRVHIPPTADLHSALPNRQVFISLRRLPPVASSPFNLPFLTTLLSIPFPFSLPFPTLHHPPPLPLLFSPGYKPSPAEISDHHVVPTCKDLLIISSLKHRL